MLHLDRTSDSKYCDENKLISSTIYDSTCALFFTFFFKSLRNLSKGYIYLYCTGLLCEIHIAAWRHQSWSSICVGIKDSPPLNHSYMLGKHLTKGNRDQFLHEYVIFVALHAVHPQLRHVDRTGNVRRVAIGKLKIMNPFTYPPLLVLRRDMDSLNIKFGLCSSNSSSGRLEMIFKSFRAF
ncbi:UNVERIFIED_CONTAM: hypothetical protein Sindi_1635500 [Sesamum indicum]